MAEVALTNIVAGLDDGTRIEIPAGETINKKSGLTEDLYDQLKEAGAIGPPPAALADVIAEENEELQAEIEVRDARIADLEAALAAATKK